ncbi:MAG: hypothetical protein JNJ61_02310 [Anaerolineae bacterium]|nr:hypothetical protein [Anaerolineae bacterium]
MAVDSKLIRQLKHNDPQQRRKAIIALADSRDLAAVQPLAQIAQSDPDEKLRALAERAQKHLQEQAARAEARATNPPPAQASERDVKRAKSYMDEAMSHYINKDNAKATRALTKALQVNPTLKTDSYFQSLVGNITGKNGEEGISLLVNAQSRVEFIQTSERGKVQKRKDDHRAKAVEIGWASAIFDLGVYGLVMLVMSFLTPFVVIQLLTSALAYQSGLSVEDLQAETIQFSPEFNEMVGSAQGIGIVTFLVSALITAAASIFTIIVLCGVIHLVARYLLRGNGTLPFMISKLVPWYSFTTPVFFIWGFIALGMLSIGAGIFGVICSGFIPLASLFVMFKGAARIGEAYDFGAAKGCLSQGIALVLLGVLNFLAGYLLAGQAAVNMLNMSGF